MPIDRAQPKSETILTRLVYQRCFVNSRLWWRATVTLALLGLVCHSAMPNVPASVKPKYRVIGYVYERTDIYAINASLLTHINYAFALVSNTGEVVLNNPSSPAHLSQLQALKARNPALKVIVSVGGWGADNFSDAALTDQARAKFADSAVDMIKRYGLDGIDLDWEYPGQPGPGIKYRAEDKENFTLLLKQLRQRLDALSRERGRSAEDRYTLSIASADGDYFKHTEMDKLHVYLDWINIMAYDFYTETAPTTGHHTALYRSLQAGDATTYTEASVKQHLGAGIPPGKLVVGAAFYGRGWTGVKPVNNGLYQTYERYVKSYSYAVLLRDYINKGGFKRYWDAAAKAPYLWNIDSNTLISYEDPESLKAKAGFVKAHHLGGIMYWEQSQDAGDVLLKTLAESLR